METRHWIEVIAAATIPLALIVIFLSRLTTEETTEKRVRFRMKGVGVRNIQFIAVATIFPTVLILSLESKLEGAAVAAILAGTLGYLLSNIFRFDDRDRDQ